MEAFGQLLVERLVAEAFHFGLGFGILGNVVEFDVRPACRNRDHAGGGDTLPFGERFLGRFVELAGNFQIVGFLETVQRVLGAHAHLAVDHAGAPALPVEHDLRLHHRAIFGIGDFGLAIGPLATARIHAIARIGVVVRSHAVRKVVVAIGLVTVIFAAIGAGDGLRVLFGVLTAHPAGGECEGRYGDEEKIAHGEAPDPRGHGWSRF